MYIIVQILEFVQKGVFMERRTKKTKISIYNAFTELLLNEKYSKITIQQITDLADIGRSTFYSHFETKDELLKSICTDIFNEMHFKNNTLESSSPDCMIADILHHIKENKKIIKGVFLSESGEMLMDYFKDYFSNQIEEHFFNSYDASLTGIPKDFLINHICGSFFEMVKWWVLGNMKQSPEELARYFIFVISPIVMKINAADNIKYLR